jgi:hypothetical protein
MPATGAAATDGMDARGSFTTLRAEFPDAGVPLRALAEPATPF